MQSKRARSIQESVNLANLGLLEFRLVRGVGSRSGSPSPDVADAFVLTFTEVGRGQLSYPLIVKSASSFLFCSYGSDFGLFVVAQSDCVDLA
jgi:hypothetical protein